MMSLIFLVAVSFALGAIVAFPIAYAMGGEIVHKRNTSVVRALREARQQRRQA